MSRTPILFAVLGMLKLRPMTGYEIKQVYQKGPANFMPISFGQIYPVLAKLRQDKMVRQDKQQGGRGMEAHRRDEKSKRDRDAVRRRCLHDSEDRAAQQPDDPAPQALGSDRVGNFGRPRGGLRPRD